MSSDAPIGNAEALGWDDGSCALFDPVEMKITVPLSNSSATTKPMIFRTGKCLSREPSYDPNAQTGQLTMVARYGSRSVTRRDSKTFAGVTFANS